MQLGLFLKRYRQGVYLSGKQLANKIGITSHALEKYENAGIMPGYEAASKLQRFFGITNLKDIKESELQFCIEHSFIIPGDNRPLQKETSTKRNLQDTAAYNLVIEEKDKKIAELEELVELLKEQIRIIKSGKN